MSSLTGLMGCERHSFLPILFSYGEAQQSPTEDRRPETADRRPPTGDRRPPTADRRPPTGDRRPKTADRRPETGDRRPETGDRRPETADGHLPDSGHLRKKSKIYFTYKIDYMIFNDYGTVFETIMAQNAKSTHFSVFCFFHLREVKLSLLALIRDV
jgi:hypothetical protein